MAARHAVSPANSPKRAVWPPGAALGGIAEVPAARLGARRRNVGAGRSRGAAARDAARRILTEPVARGTARAIAVGRNGPRGKGD